MITTGFIVTLIGIISFLISIVWIIIDKKGREKREYDLLNNIVETQYENYIRAFGNYSTEVMEDNTLYRGDI